jgi:predicted transcriptional regulator
MRASIVQVVIDKGIKERLAQLAAAEDRSVSSLVRALIIRHLIAIDQAHAQNQKLHGVYD